MTINRLKTAATLSAVSAALVGIGALLGTPFLVALAVAAVALSTALYLRADRMLLWLHGAKPLKQSEQPLLHAMVDSLARRAGISKPCLFRIAEPGANAFALGRRPELGSIVVTDGLLATLNERELRAVMAHEIAHLKQGDTLTGSVVVGLGAAFAHALHTLLFAFVIPSPPDDKDPPPLAPALNKGLAPLLAPLVRLGASRQRELDADAYAVALTGEPAALRSALERLQLASMKMPLRTPPASAALYIVNPLTEVGLATWLSTHPPIEERIQRLKEASPQSVTTFEPKRVPVFRACRPAWLTRPA